MANINLRRTKDVGYAPTRALEIVVCVDSRFGFAKNGRIPWDFKKDLKHFQEITKDHYCIMGRNTFEDIMRMVEKRKGRLLYHKESPLPNRTTIVLSRNPKYTANGMEVFPSLREATDHCEDENKKVFILGGEKLFIEALTDTTTIHLTIIDREYNCTQKFPGCGISPDYLATHFNIVSGKKVKSSTRKNARELTFLELERIR